MYKVFLNDRKIIFATAGKITFKQPTVFFDESTSRNELKEWFLSFVRSNAEEAILLHPSGEKLFLLFRSVFIALPAAGGVVMQNGMLLFIFRNGKWDLPKGKIDDGESPAEAALREVQEECGILGHKIVKQLPSTFHIYQSPYKKTKGQWIFKETTWYEMNYSGIESGTPQTEEGITKVTWLGKNDLNKVLKNTYENLKQIILLYT